VFDGQLQICGVLLMLVFRQTMITRVIMKTIPLMFKNFEVSMPEFSLSSYIPHDTSKMGKPGYSYNRA
jgi:hypothetical protein